MTEEAKTPPNPIGQAIANVESAHAADLAGANNVPPAGDKPAEGTTTTVVVEKPASDAPATPAKVDVDGVHVETGTLADKPKE